MRPIIFMAWLLAAPALPAAEITIHVRDAVSGAPLSAQLRVTGNAASRVSDFDIANGRARVSLEAGSGTFVIAAEGHRAISAKLTLDAHPLPLTFLLDPDSAPAESRQARAIADTSPGMAVLHGWTRRGKDAAAVAGARVSVPRLSATATTDANGHFLLVLPASEARDGTDLPRVALRVEATDGTRTTRELLLVPGAQSTLVMLDAPATPDHASFDPARALRENTPAPIATATTRPLDASSISAITPPATLRVGFGDAACSASCCTGSCSNTCVLSLETYVARGLNDEWIASWGAQSLRAGSIAYRSYAAYHVLHPRAANYDICSSACCQVNDPDTSASTDAAVARTPGIALTRDNVEPFRAEYSAENNAWDDPNDGLSCSNVDLSCGDGSVGSPSASWPCQADSVGAGHGCFGHGRGMSQWGTQRWSQQSRNWRWIADHYFNDNANVGGAGTGLRTATLTTPLTISSASAMPNNAAPGATLALNLSAANSAGAAHTHLLIGASLYRAGPGYLSDAAHDAPATLAANSTAVNLQRDFQIPANATAGVYALDVSLYLDVDENSTITSEDLRLGYLRVDNAVTVATAADALFADSFE